MVYLVHVFFFFFFFLLRIFSVAISKRESSYLFYLSSYFDLYVSKIMHL